LEAEMVWFRKLCVSFLMVVVIGDSAFTVTLERISKERFTQALTMYSKQQSGRQFKKIVGYGLLGVGGVGLGIWGVSRLVNQYNETGSSAGNSDIQTTQNCGSMPRKDDTKSFLDSVTIALKHMTAYSLAVGFVAGFQDIWRDGYAYIKNALGSPATINALYPFSQRLTVELDRLRGSMLELQRHRDNPTLVQFHKKEIISAFNILVNSLEKFGAVLYWHIQDANKNDNAIWDDCSNGIDHLFVFCDDVARRLEDDLNQKDISFFVETIDVVNGLAKAIFFLSNTYVTLSKNGG